MISKSQFRVLSHLIEDSKKEVPISTLAEELNWSAGHTSRVVSELEAQGCVRTEEIGRQRRVTLADIEPVEQLEALIAEYSHVDFSDHVAGHGLQLLYYLDHPRTATELAESSGVSRATVYRRLDDLQAVGIVGKSKSHYQLNEPFSALSAIARGLAHRKHRREARRYAEGVSILWENHEEFLFACDGELSTDDSTDDFYLTGPSLFAEFEIPLLTRSRRYYIRTNQLTRVSPEDLVCHTLIIDDGPRYRIYCLLLIEKEEIRNKVLRERAEHYASEASIDLLAIIDELVAYLESEGTVTADRLPSWKDFKSTAADYEINV